MHRVSRAQRSKTGCWTCRLRRKKCNEGGPPCANCESRGVFCHGYGPKPPWKDRGEKEKEQAGKLQIQPRQRWSNSKNPSGDILPHSPAMGASNNNSDCSQEINAPLIHSPSQSDLSLSSLSSPQDRQGFEFLDSLDLSGSWGSDGFSNDIWLGSSSTEALVGSQNVEPPTGNLLPNSTDAQDSSSEPLLSPSSVEALVGFNGVHPPTRSLRHDYRNDANGFSSGSWPGPSLAETSNKLDGFQPPTGDPRHRPAVCLPPAAGAGAQASDADEKEFEFFMHFIGETFALQHTSYRVASTMQRSWLLLLLMRSPTFYYASLSMSAYHHYLNLSRDSEVRTSTFRAYQKYRICALTRFNELLKSDHRSPSPSGPLPEECMICGVQIALLEVRKANKTSSAAFR